MHRLLTALAAARFLRTSEAARFLVLSPTTLEKRRCSGAGPKYLKHGGRVTYVGANVQQA